MELATLGIIFGGAALLIVLLCIVIIYIAMDRNKIAQEAQLALLVQDPEVMNMSLTRSGGLFNIKDLLGLLLKLPELIDSLKNKLKDLSELDIKELNTILKGLPDNIKDINEKLGKYDFSEIQKELEEIKKALQTTTPAEVIIEEEPGKPKKGSTKKTNKK